MDIDRKANWQFILCDSPNPSNPAADLVELGELESARARSVQIVRNRSGSASCQISIYDDLVPTILDKVPTGDVRGTLRRSLLVRRNKVDMFGGPITSIQGSLADGASTLTLSAAGWMEYLFHRELAADKHYTDLPLDDIAFDLLTVANLQDPSFPVPVFAGTSSGDSLDDTLFSPTFTKGETFGASIQKLSDVENGFDFEVNPRTREMNIFSWDSYTVRNNIRLGYRWGPENIDRLDWTESGTNTRNRITAVAADNVPYSSQDLDSILEYGLFQETINFPGSGPELVPAFLNAELVIKARPQITYSITPKAVGIVDEKTPRLFEDFFIGDQISFTAKEGFFEVNNQGIRVFGADISISDDGIETIGNLQTSPATA